MNPNASQRAMFVKLKGKNVRLGTDIVINTGNKDRHVKLVEQHKKAPSKICVLYHNKKFLVEKSKVIST